jgi:hypothetical protein
VYGTLHAEMTSNTLSRLYELIVYVHIFGNFLTAPRSLNVKCLYLPNKTYDHMNFFRSQTQNNVR